MPGVLQLPMPVLRVDFRQPCQQTSTPLLCKKHKLGVSLLRGFNHMTCSCLIFHILPVLSESIDCLVEFFVEGQRLQYPPDLRIPLPTYRFPELAAESYDVEVCIRQCLGQPLVLLAIVDSFIVT